MTLIKNKAAWIVAAITILGTILRLIFIDKAEGLWNDEYISWHIASIPFGKDFFNAAFAQCHMPLYYLYLKFFIHFFGDSDLILRLTSALSGSISIIAMFFIGKELKGNKVGYLCAAITALSSFCIYFSQEVRFYSLLFLISAIMLIFTIRLAKTQNKFNIIGYLTSSALVILTHTIGFVYVFFNSLFVSFLINKINPKYKKGIIAGWLVLFTIGLFFAPFLIKTFTEHNYSQWWAHFNFAKIGFLMTDYFSPILTNIVDSPSNFFYNFNFEFVFFAIFPVLIAIIGISNAVKSKDYKIVGLFLVSLAFIQVLITMSMLGKLAFATKYSIEIYPTLIALMALGLVNISKKKLSNFLIFSFCFISLFYLISNQNSAPKMRHNQGNKLVAGLIENSGIKEGDFIVLNYYSKDKFEKYFDFKKYNVIEITKETFTNYLGNISIKDSIENGKLLYEPIFADQKNKHFTQEINKVLLSKMKKGQKVTVIIMNEVAMFSPTQIQTIVSQPEKYAETPFLFLVFSYLKNEEMQELLKKLSITRLEQKGSWTALTFTKIN